MAATETRTPSLDEFKQFARDVAPAARACLMARAHAEFQGGRLEASRARPLPGEGVHVLASGAVAA